MRTTQHKALRAGRRAQITAADTAYSDQSHLIRTTRRITGFTPEALGKGIQHHESFWAYRLWM
ncbi:hypothetical protein [Rhodoferax aquaticus]|uniref:AraC family transcriptional regulator n=1 Tax=Rhodoferax aquaticus TaxID=2527691 RepID=A0A515EKQ9_9BURK|nr:hypothetical protein [Rhodoferax aquaticus]QDL53241.1 hypothetical protein EXZ61_03095 [Rhodoferax aquaticus]